MDVMKWQLMSVLSCKGWVCYYLGPWNPLWRLYIADCFRRWNYIWLWVLKIFCSLVQCISLKTGKKGREGRMGDVIPQSYGKSKWLKKRQTNNNSLSDSNGLLHAASLPCNMSANVGHSIPGAMGKISFSLRNPAITSLVSSWPSQVVCPHCALQSGLKAAPLKHGKALQTHKLSGKCSCNVQILDIAPKEKMSTLGSKTVSQCLR